MWRDSESDQDFLNFTEVAEQIATLATTPSLLPVSIGVFGTWGTGKSTVLKLVEKQLEASKTAGNETPVVVKFDAWLYQGFDDARAALMEVVASELLRIAEEKKTYVEKAKEFASRINYFRGLGLIADFGVGMAMGIPPGLLTSAGNAVSSLWKGTATPDQYEKLKEQAGDAKGALDDLIRPAEKRTPPKEIDAFRKEFGELLRGLNTTLILFIDNLDRCLPDVAIGTLEAVRLFLFMPQTAFVIAADEDMIRHSVAKHFRDPNVAHVRDYLDKVIQVPLRVPQVGVEDLRAYMYSLFVAEAAPGHLDAVQRKLMTSLQNAWNDATFEKAEIAEMAGNSPELLDKLAIADRLAPILARAPKIEGNPRIVKRLLNAISLRRTLASKREMNVDFATLAKLAVFERCTDGPATTALYRMIMEGKDAEKHLSSPAKMKGDQPEAPKEWASHAEFIDEWRGMEPNFDNPAKLRPAVFLSRDAMAPARSRSDLSDAAREAATALAKIDNINSPVGKSIVQGLTETDRKAAMSVLIEMMRDADWSAVVPGVYGALLLADVSADAKAEFKAFVGGLKSGEFDKGVKFALKKSGIIGA